MTQPDTRRREGICGDEAPLLVGTPEIPAPCILDHGHASAWHQAEDGLTWKRTAHPTAVIEAVALTLRQIATWSPTADTDPADRAHVNSAPATAEEWRSLADQVEQLEPGWTCPMCQEVVCDGGCPLEHVRAAMDAEHNERQFAAAVEPRVKP